MLWTPVRGTRLSWDKDGFYAMGWGVVPAADPAKGPRMLQESAILRWSHRRCGRRVECSRGLAAEE
jgi:hypothetical protein